MERSRVHTEIYAMPRDELSQNNLRVNEYQLSLLLLLL
jgi:hypothetical protein